MQRQLFYCCQASQQWDNSCSGFVITQTKEAMSGQWLQRQYSTLSLLLHGQCLYCCQMTTHGGENPPFYVNTFSLYIFIRKISYIDNRKTDFFQPLVCDRQEVLYRSGDRQHSSYNTPATLFVTLLIRINSVKRAYFRFF